ncbi:MAG TPA: nitroreductase family deazaflavin-dependent oxidoreductase [Actinomycetota bacterium]|nr:nitroreductase family deazaflavin-dependent oxidoreductase [Actinomycetota bacterium]
MDLAKRGLSKIRALLNPVVAAAVRAGLPPRSAHILTTRGRRTGEPRSTPVILVERGGTRYLVAPYGEVDWVHNVRADPHVTLSRGGSAEEVRAVEVDAGEGGPVLKDYVDRWWPAVAPYFEAGPSDPVEAFAAEIRQHPVFRLSPAD